MSQKVRKRKPTGVAGLFPVSVKAEILSMSKAAPVKASKKVAVVDPERMGFGPVTKTPAYPPGRASEGKVVDA